MIPNVIPRVGYILISLSILASWSAQAESVVAGSVYNESKEAEVVQKARRRTYPGGPDEGDLAVQSQLTAPTRKIAPQAPEQESHADD